MRVDGGEAVIHNDPKMVKRLEIFPELCPSYHARPAPRTPPTEAAGDAPEASAPAEPEPEALLGNPRKFRVRTVTDPVDIAKTLAKYGLYPRIDADAIDSLLVDGIEKEANRPMTQQIRDDLKLADSYSKQRTDAAKRAHVEQTFLDRIAKAPETRGAE